MISYCSDILHELEINLLDENHEIWKQHKNKYSWN